MYTLTTLHVKTKMVSFLILLISLPAFSMTYTTIADGAYNDPSIWSTDGGLTPCNCVAPEITSGANVEIFNNVTLNSHLIVDGGSEFTVYASGSITGPSYNFTTYGFSTVNFFGPCSFKRFTNGLTTGTQGSIVNISGAIVEFNGRIQLFAGATTVEGGYVYVTTGNFEVYQNAAFNVSGGSKLELFNGNISIGGVVDICSDCCLTTSGNWTNEVTGVVSGSGSATTTGGNMSNFNDFSFEITWCSQGFDTGMPSTEDCSSSNTTCGIVALPVELTYLDVIHRDELNEVIWETASESNSDYFTVQRSVDGYNWTDIATLKAAGNSLESNYYSYRDAEFSMDKPVIYYRLEQVDLDGKRMLSYPVSVLNKLPEGEFTMFPNPVQKGANLHCGVSDAEEGDLQIMNSSGVIVYQTSLNKNHYLDIISTADFSSGIYFVSYISAVSGMKEHSKLVIR